MATLSRLARAVGAVVALALGVLGMPAVARAACPPARTVKVDLAAWRKQFLQPRRSPAALNRLLARLRLPPVPEQVEGSLGGPPCRPEATEVTITSAPLTSRVPTDRVVQVHLTACETRLIRAQVLRPEGAGFCALADRQLSVDLSDAERACLGPPAPEKKTEAPLLIETGELIDPARRVLRVVSQGGGCFGIERGADFRVIYYRADPDRLTYQLYLAAYRSPTPPVKETTTRLTVSGAYPKVVTLTREVSCRQLEPDEKPEEPCRPAVTRQKLELRGGKYQPAP